MVAAREQLCHTPGTKLQSQTRVTPLAPLHLQQSVLIQWKLGTSHNPTDWT